MKGDDQMTVWLGREGRSKKVVQFTEFRIEQALLKKIYAGSAVKRVMSD